MWKCAVRAIFSVRLAIDTSNNIPTAVVFPVLLYYIGNSCRLITGKSSRFHCVASYLLRVFFSVSVLGGPAELVLFLSSSGIVAGKVARLWSPRRRAIGASHFIELWNPPASVMIL